MVERCADCGFDLAGGKVEVIPTAHYMMGGVQFNVDCTTEMPRLYAAGEDTGGVHGANRLGGNGVANSTVFGGLAGDSMAATLRAYKPLADPDKAAIEAAHERAYAPLGRRRGDLESVRRRLYQVMWDDVGILRTADGACPRPPRAEQPRHRDFHDGRGRSGEALQPDLDGPAQPGKSGAGRAARSAPPRRRAPTAAARITARISRKPPSSRTRITPSCAPTKTASRSRPSRWCSAAFAPANRCCRRRRNDRCHAREGGHRSSQQGSALLHSCAVNTGSPLRGR